MATRESRLESLANYVPRGGSSTRAMVAAVCYRRRRDAIEFLLVRTRSGRWTFPKGAVNGDLSHAAAADREALEEAGVRGRTDSEAFVYYRHAKSGDGREELIGAYLCEVDSIASASEPFRFPTWFSAEQARTRLVQGRHADYAAELHVVLDRALARIARNR